MIKNIKIKISAKYPSEVSRFLTEAYQKNLITLNEDGGYRVRPNGGRKKTEISNCERQENRRAYVRKLLTKRIPEEAQDHKKVIQDLLK